MSRKTRIAAVLAAAASLTAAAGAPATASTQASDDAIVCYNEINAPSCVNWTFDVANRTITYAEDTVVPVAQGAANTAACLALEVVTGRDCPYWPPPR